MAKKKKGGHAGGHGWFVTFADLMGLLMSFFVMLTAYSTMDQRKMQAVAGSMADAFGVMKDSRLAGIVEVNGVPTRPNAKNLETVDIKNATDHPSPRQRNTVIDGVKDPAFEMQMANAASSIRQALEDNPDLAEVSNQVIVEETPQGLMIELVDQDGRSMFAEGSSLPNARVAQLVSALAPILAHLPNQLRIAGHTARQGLDGRTYDRDSARHWRLSSERALAVRDELSAAGIGDDRFAEVVGQGDTAPVFPEDPSLAANRRVSVLLLDTAMPLPLSLAP